MDRPGFDNTIDELKVIDELVDRFEDTWGNPDSTIGQCLAQIPTRFSKRHQLLIELVCIDIAQRWNCQDELKLDNLPMRPKVEDYLRAFPELGDKQSVPIELVIAEQRARESHGDPLSLDEAMQRFPSIGRKELGEFMVAGEYSVSSEVTTDWSRGIADTQIVTPKSTDATSTELPDIPGYEISELINSGGMGSVFKARDLKLDRVVAIKLPRPELMSDAEGRERFMREARSAARLRHVNICPIYEIGEWTNRPYISMAFVDGITLKDQVATPREVAETVAKLARAVEHAHKHGVIHRDIKPANVLVESETGEPILTDFGLAKELSDQQSDMTHTGQVMGTPAYMAPEQAAGRIDEVGPLSDVYALGAVLYELVCGAPPFQGPVGEVLRKVQTEEPISPRKLKPKLHTDLETICLKALAKGAKDRYQSARALAEDLERFIAGETIVARRTSVVTRTARALAKRPVTTALVLLLAVLAFVAVGLVSRILENDRIDRAISSIDRELATEDWSEEKFDRIWEQLDELGVLSEEHAKNQRQRVRQNLMDEVSSRVTAIRITSQAVQETQSVIDLLRKLDTEEATRFTEALNDRIAVGVTKIDLRAPFDDHLTVFSDVSMAAKDGALFVDVSNGSEESQSLLPLLTNVSCDRNVSLKAKVDSTWRSASVLSLMLDARDGHNDAVAVLSFSLNGDLLASGGKDGRVIVWDVGSGNQLFKLDGFEMLNCQMEFSPSGEYLVTREHKGTVQVWNCGTGELVHEIPRTTSRFRFTSDGKMLVTGSTNPLVTFWNVGDWTKHREITYEGRAISLALSPDGEQLAVGFKTHEIYLWDLTADTEPRVLAVHRAWPSFIEYSPNGKQLACGSFDQSVALWDVASGNKIGSRHIPQDRGLGLNFSADGSRLFVTRATQINVWELKTSEFDPSAIKTLTTQRASNLVLIDGGKRLAASDGLTVNVWDAGRLESPIMRIGLGRMPSLAASPDGNLLAAGKTNGIIEVWDMLRKRKRLTLGQTGYEAYLGTAIEPSKQSGPSFTRAIAEGDQIAMRISRAGELLRERVLPSAALDFDSLQLEFERRNQVVSFRLNDEFEVSFEELFPIHPSERGVYGVGLQANVGLNELTATTIQLSSTPSPLESADELFANGNFSEAADFFHQTAISESDAEIRQEAIYKQGICRLENGQPREAITILDELKGQPPSRWTKLATFQLWVIWLEIGEPQKADELFDQLAVSSDLDELSVIVPMSVRRSILARYGERLFNYRNLFQISRSRVDDVRIVERVSRLLGVEPETDLQFELLRAHRLMGEDDIAIDLAKKLYKSSPTSRVIHHLSWLLRKSGNVDAARDLVNSSLNDDAGQLRAEMVRLLIERARIHAQEREWSLAERDIDQYLNLEGQDENGEYKYGLPAALLMKGFLCQRSGDNDAAIEAWTKAYRPWKQFMRVYSVPDSEKPTAFIQFHILGSLTQKLRYAESKFFVDKAIESALPSSIRAPLMAVFLRPEMLGKVVVLMQEIWRKPNGRLWAERIAFEEITYAEIFRTVAILPIYEVLVSRSFKQTPSEKEAKLLWDTLNTVFQQALQTRELHENQAMLLAMSWATGMDFTQNSNLKEWVEQSPETAAGFAYLCAKRCEVDGKTSQANMLYSRVGELVGNESLAGSLANTELNEIE